VVEYSFVKDRISLDDFIGLSTYDDVIDCLEKHVTRIMNSDFEDPQNAELISRVFAAIVEEGNIRFRQEHLNAAKQAIATLWRHGLFETRYVLPNQRD